MIETRLNVLVVDDDLAIRKIFSDLIASEDVFVKTCGSAEEGVEKLLNQYFDVIFVDLKLPGMSGEEFLEKAKKTCPKTEFVIMTGFGSIESAVYTLKVGAWDYLTKPFKLSQIKLILNKIQKLKKIMSEVVPIKKSIEIGKVEEKLIGMTPEFEEICEMVQKLSQEDCNVLIVGESGTGKELIARAIHFNSPRSSNPFIPIDCASINKNLIESELFGHEKGAFTSAVSKKEGLIHKANGGTAFFDEISEIPIETQPTLLRAIETKKIRPVGSTNYIDVDVRIIAATNRDLENFIKENKFRLDLYYRLNVVTINVPALRNRKDDIPLLVRHFIASFNEKTNKKVKGVTRDAEVILLRYDWPGNVRELRHVIERAFAMGASNFIDVPDLPPTLVSAVEQKSYIKATSNQIKTLEQVEYEAIVNTLNLCKGDINKCAKALGIHITTLYRKMEKYSIPVKK